MKVIEIFAAIAFLAAAQMPMQANAETMHRSSAVSIAGLDMTKAEDAQTALDRIERAASDVCGGSFAHRYSMTGQAYRACRAETVAATVHRVNTPMLTYAFEAEYGAAPMQMAMR